jgi:hypothetical protein
MKRTAVSIIALCAIASCSPQVVVPPDFPDDADVPGWALKRGAYSEAPVTIAPGVTVLSARAVFTSIDDSERYFEYTVYRTGSFDASMRVASTLDYRDGFETPEGCLLLRSDNGTIIVSDAELIDIRFSFDHRNDGNSAYPVRFALERSSVRSIPGFLEIFDRNSRISYTEDTDIPDVPLIGGMVIIDGRRVESLVHENPGGSGARSPGGSFILETGRPRFFVRARDGRYDILLFGDAYRVLIGGAGTIPEGKRTALRVLGALGGK